MEINVGKNYFKNLVAKGKTKEVIDELFKYINAYLTDFDDSEVKKNYNYLIIVSRQYNSIHHKESLGIIGQQEIEISSNKINYRLIEVIDNMPQNFFLFLNGVKTEIKSEKNYLGEKNIQLDQERKFKYDIFLSFSIRDLEEAKIIAYELRNNGLEVFLSDEALILSIGKSFFEKIDFALKNSKAFILLSSINSMNSEWVKIEYETFFNEFYLKDKNNRPFFVLKSKYFDFHEVPTLLKRLQFASNSKEILTILQRSARQHGIFDSGKEKVLNISKEEIEIPRKASKSKNLSNKINNGYLIKALLSIGLVISLYYFGSIFIEKKKHEPTTKNINEIGKSSSSNHIETPFSNSKKNKPKDIQQGKSQTEKPKELRSLPNRVVIGKDFKNIESILIEYEEFSESHFLNKENLLKWNNIKDEENIPNGAIIYLVPKKWQ